MFAAAEANQMAVLESTKDTDTQPVELYWAMLRSNREAIEFVRTQSTQRPIVAN